MSRPSFFQRLLRSRLLFVGCLLALVVLGVGIGRQILRNRDLAADIASLERRARELEADHLRVSALQQALQTESYLEQESRLKLGLKKPGETVVVMRESSSAPDAFRPWEELAGDAAPPSAVSASADISAPVRVSNPVRWWYYFFDRAQFNALAIRDR